MDDTLSRQDNPFHAGEQAVHERLGIRDRMLGLGQRVIRSFMPEQQVAARPGSMPERNRPPR